MCPEAELIPSFRWRSTTRPRATRAALGPADGLAGELGLDVALGDGLGPPAGGMSGLVTKKAAPTAITPSTVAASNAR